MSKPIETVGDAIAVLGTAARRAAMAGAFETAGVHIAALAMIEDLSTQITKLTPPEENPKE